jgi:hypothetical protein
VPQALIENPSFPTIDRPDDRLLFARAAVGRIIKRCGQNVRGGQHLGILVNLIARAERLDQTAGDGMLAVDDLCREAMARRDRGLGRPQGPPPPDHLRILGPGRLFEVGDSVAIG